MGAFRCDSAWGGENKNMLFVGFRCKFNSGFGADKLYFGEVLTELIDTFDSGGIAGDDDNFGILVFKGFDVVFCNLI